MSATPAPSDADLLATAAALRAEAADMLAAADLAAAFADLGPPEVVGSYVSDLMVWRDLDVMFTAPDAGAGAVLAGLARMSAGDRLLSADFRDERGDRRPTPARTDERYYVVCGYDWPGGVWKLDLTVWLHRAERPQRGYAERLAAGLDHAQRLAILRIKQVWHQKPTYPYQVGGMDVYTAVVDDGVRSPDEFGRWLADRGRP